LSPLPLPSPELSLEDDTEVALTSALTAISETDFKGACASCPVQNQLRELLTSRWPKSAKSLLPNWQPFFKNFFQTRSTRWLSGAWHTQTLGTGQPPTKADLLGTWHTPGNCENKAETQRSILVAKHGCPGWGSHLSMHYMPVTWQVCYHPHYSTTACATSRRSMGKSSYWCGRSLW